MGGFDRLACRIDEEEILIGPFVFILAAGCDQELEWFIAYFDGEIAACAHEPVASGQHVLDVRQFVPFFL